MCLGGVPNPPPPPDIVPPVVPAPPRVKPTQKLTNPRASGAGSRSKRRQGKRSLTIPRGSGLNTSGSGY